MPHPVIDHAHFRQKYWSGHGLTCLSEEAVSTCTNTGLEDTAESAFIYGFSIVIVFSSLFVVFTVHRMQLSVHIDYSDEVSFCKEKLSIVVLVVTDLQTHF